MSPITKLLLPLIIGLASIIGIGDLIHACVDSSTGAIRIVVDSASCGDEETLLEWNTGEDVAALQEQVTALQAQVAALEAKLVHVTTAGNEITISGANLHVVSGSGTTNGDPNGLGNVIIGYNELRSEEDNVRTGSHMLVVGRENNYSSFGGIVVGIHNQTSIMDCLAITPSADLTKKAACGQLYFWNLTLSSGVPL